MVCGCSCHPRTFFIKKNTVFSFLSLMFIPILLSLQWLRMKVYEHLWNKGYFLTSAIKFGGDFLVYPGKHDCICIIYIYIYVCVCVFYTLISLIHAYLSFQVIHIATTPIMLPLSHPGSPISALLTSLPLDALVSELFMSSFSFFRSFVCSFLQKLLTFLRV